MFIFSLSFFESLESVVTLDFFFTLFYFLGSSSIFTV